MNIAPCPFCGCEPVQLHDEDSLLYCANEFCPIHLILVAEERWNTRPVTTHLSDKEQEDLMVCIEAPVAG